MRAIPSALGAQHAPMPSIRQNNVTDLAKLIGPEAQRREIFQILGDLDQYDLLDEEVLLAIYVPSNVLTEGTRGDGSKWELVSTENASVEARYQGTAFMLIKAGPSAWKYHNNGQDYEGHVPQSGDWVVMNASDGRELYLRGMESGLGKAVACKRTHWRSIYMRVTDPRVVH